MQPRRGQQISGASKSPVLCITQLSLLPCRHAQQCTPGETSLLNQMGERKDQLAAAYRRVCGSAACPLVWQGASFSSWIG